MAGYDQAGLRPRNGSRASDQADGPQWAALPSAAATARGEANRTQTQQQHGAGAWFRHG